MCDRLNALTISMIALAASMCYDRLYNRPDPPEMCESPGCESTRNLILKLHDPSADPCNEFFRYVCGGANKYNFEETQEEMAIEKGSLRLKHLLHPSNTSETIASRTIAANFLNGCRDSRPSRNTSFEKLPGVDTQLYTTLMNWVDLSVRARNAGLRHDFFLEISTVFDRNTFRWRIELAPPLSSRKYQGVWNEWHRSSIKILLNYWKRNHNDIGTTTREELNDVINYGRLLTTFNFGKKTDVKILKIGKLKVKNSFIPNWLVFLKQITQIDTLTADDEISVVGQLHGDGKYWKMLEYLGHKRSRFWFNYIAVVTMLDECYFLEEPALSACSTILGSDKQMFCLQIFRDTFAGLTEANYIRATVTRETRVKALDLIRQIKTELMRQIEVTSFSEARARTAIANSMDKLVISMDAWDVIYNPHDFEKYYGTNLNISDTDEFSERYNKARKRNADRKFNALVAKTEKETFTYFNDLSDIRRHVAFYDSLLHVIYIQPDLLVLPHFSLDRPHYLNVAAFGSTVAHEMIHSVVNQGLATPRTSPKWNSSDDQSHRSRVQCITKQYDEYLKSIGVRLTSPARHNHENVADVAEMKASYKTFLDIAQSERSVAKLLFDEKQFSINQLYWIVRGLDFCESDPMIARRIGMDVSGWPMVLHGHPHYRVASGPMNSHDFARDFHCTAGDPMNPNEKCHIFGE